jgi:hypothetical protein
MWKPSGGSVRRLCSHLVTIAAVAVGCDDGTGPDTHPATVQYQFALAAFGGDTTPERARTYDCFVYGFFAVPLPVAAAGRAQFPIRVERRLFETRGNHSEATLADSSIGEGVLEYSGLGQDTLRFVLTAGPYRTSLGPGGLASNAPPECSGEWICGPDVPLAHDSTLLAYGYDAGVTTLGTWRVSEIQPVE